jgi:galactokinase
MINMRELAAQFRARFNASPQIYRAPGRVNLIGEHTDYNLGLVMPVAIQFDTNVAIAAHSQRRLNIHSVNMDADLVIDLPVSFTSNEAPATSGSWADYVVGVVWALGRAGIALSGADLLISGSVPIGAGLSSSAALEVAVAAALLGIGDHALPPMQLAQLCQRAENDYVGMRCGLMDQFASAMGVAHHALYFDCRSLEHEPIQLGDAALVICNSRMKHRHAGGEYNRRRAECEAGVAAFAARRSGIHSLRDVEADELKAAQATLDPVVYRRCRHVLEENARVGAMRRALRAGALEEAGQLMFASHRSLRDDYAVSCGELNLLVDLATQVGGVYGARMTGGGFGGCTVNLMHPDSVEPFTRYVSAHYAQRTGRPAEIHICRATDGAGRIA